MLTHDIVKDGDGYSGRVVEFCYKVSATGLSEQSVWNQLNELCRIYHGGELAPLKTRETA